MKFNKLSYDKRILVNHELNLLYYILKDNYNDYSFRYKWSSVNKLTSNHKILTNGWCHGYTYYYSGRIKSYIERYHGMMHGQEITYSDSKTPIIVTRTWENDKLIG